MHRCTLFASLRSRSAGTYTRTAACDTTPEELSVDFGDCMLVDWVLVKGFNISNPSRDL